MRFSKYLLALGAFFALGIAVAGCGSGIPGNSVADVAGNPISFQTFDHWMYVAAKGNAAQNPGAPVIVPTDPPSFNACIAQVRKEVSSVAKESDKTLRSDCSQLFTALSSQVMDFLIRSYWYQADAAKQHLTVTNAQVQKQFNAEKQAQFPTASEWNSFLSQYGYTQADLVYRTRVQLVYNKLINKHIKPVTASAISAYYASHLSSSFTTPAERNLRIVLTKTSSQAQAALTALKSGQSWTTVAKRYSTDPTTKDKGGVLDNVQQGQEDAALNKAAFSAPLNKLIGPVKGQFGYYVVEVTKITPGKVKTLAQARSQIQQTLMSQEQTNAQNTVDNQAKKNWLSHTQCRSAYAMADCQGYKAPKSSTTSTGSTTGG